MTPGHVEKLPARDDSPPTDDSGDVDLSLISHMLSMTPAERLNFHDAMRHSALQMRRAAGNIMASPDTMISTLNLLRRLRDQQIESLVRGNHLTI